MYSKIKLIVFLVLCNIILIINNSIAQNISLQEKQFFSSKTVTKYQIGSSDQLGYMWGIVNGNLTRMDGVKFKTFLRENENLPENITGIYIDTSNRVWIGAKSSMKYYIENNQIHYIDFPSNIDDAFIAFEKNDSIFFQSEKANKTYYWLPNQNLKEYRKTHSDPFHIINYNNSQYIAKYKEEQFPYNYVILNSQYNPVYQISNEYKMLPSIFNDETYFIRSETDKSNASKKNVSNNYLYYYNKKWDSISLFDFFETSPNKLRVLNADIKNKTVFALYNNEKIVVARNGKRDKEIEFLIEKAVTDVNNVESIYLDFQKNTWIRTHSGKLEILPVQSNYLKDYDKSFFDGYGSLKKIAIYKNYIYIISTDDVLYRLNKNSNVIENIIQIESEVNDIELLGDMLFLGTQDNCYYLNASESKIKLSKIRGNHKINTFYKDDNYLLNGDGSEQFTINQSGKVIPITRKAIQERIQFLSIINDTYWLRGFKSIFIRDVHSNDLIKELMISDVNAIKKIQDGILIGTKDGLYIVSDAGEIIKKAHEGVNIKNIALLKENQIILGTNYGVKVVEIKNQQVVENKSYTRIDGLLSNEVTDIKIDENYAYIATERGLNRLETRNSQIPYVNPKTVIENVIVNDYEIFPKENMIYEFDKTQNRIEFKITGISFYVLGNRTYRYKLEGKDKEWLTTSENSIVYSDLLPGNYTFYVSSIAGKQDVNPEAKTFTFVVKPYITDKLWFKSVLAILGVLAILSLFFKIKKEQDKKRLRKRTMRDLELKALRAQMNPHFIFNSLNGIQSTMILKGEIEANNYMSEFSKLLRITLDHNKIDCISLEEEIEYLKSYINLEKHRLNQDLEYDINVSPEINPKDTFLASMLFQPLVENAIIHGLAPKRNDRKLTVTFKKEKKYLVGSVLDNGIGRKKALQLKKKSILNYKSWATQIMKERIEILNHSNTQKILFFIDDNQIEGTLVTLKMPLTIWN